MRGLLMVIGLLLVSSGAWAAQDFTCGKSKVSIFMSENQSAAWELRVRSTVLVTTQEGASVSVSFTGNIDFIGGHCVTDAAGRSRVLFQAYCGGSGCKDLDNWGIIDPDHARILLAPNDTNHEEAQRILGTAPTPPDEMMGVYREGRRIGIDIPKEA